MIKKQRKRDRVIKALKSGGQKIATFAKSRIVRIPLLGLIAFVIPGKAMAFSLEETVLGTLQLGENATFIPVAEMKGVPKESQIAFVGDAVVQDLTGNEDITYDQVAAVTKLLTKPVSAFRKSSMMAISPAWTPRS